MSSFLAFSRFPLAKIVIFTIKHISKPISNVIKTIAKHNPHFKRYICIPPGQFYNILETRSKMFVLNLPQPIYVPPLTSAMATEIGANLLGEVAIIGIGIYLIYYEVSRQALKDQKKHDKHKQERMELDEQLDSLDKQLDKLQKELFHMKQTNYKL